jgi:hypothetical protein
MYEKILTDPNFYFLLFKIDSELAKKSHRVACKVCGGKLDWANYLRKPRGGPPCLDEQCFIRFSLCCRSDGCRKRLLAPSLRFWGRRVYFSVLFSLITTLSHRSMCDPPPILRNKFNISYQTFLRWKKWWKEIFPATVFWQKAKSLIVPGDGGESFPEVLLQVFEKSHIGKKAVILKLLLFLNSSDGLSV